MNNEYKSGAIFPYSQIAKNSNIVIYGLGRIGHLFISQIKATGYCRIIAVSDKNEKSGMKEFMELYVRPEKLSLLAYDYLVIAIDSVPIASDAFWNLVRLGVNENIIVSNLNEGGFFFPSYQYSCEKNINKKEKLQIAISLFGGMGDYVVFYSFVSRFLEISNNISIDLYGCEEVAEAIFYGLKRVKVKGGVGERFKDKYELAIRLVHFVDVEFIDYTAVRLKSPMIFEMIMKTMDDPHIQDLKFNQIGYLTIYDRAAKYKYDRYDFLGHGDIWNLKAKSYNLQLNTAYKKRFDSFGLNRRYLTINYGASRTQGRKGTLQTKVWLKRYYEELVDKLHRKYSDIEIVQLGDAISERVDGVDRTIFGENIEVVKFILQSSMIHIDGEGGLVHVATKLGTKNVVLFGPTPVEYYGYPENFNIVSDVCSNCCHITEMWYTDCILGDDSPRCMSSIKPERVYDVVCGFIDKNYMRK